MGISFFPSPQRTRLPIKGVCMWHGRFEKPIFVGLLIAAVLFGCAPLPKESPTTGERRYRYQPPSHINEVDRKECYARADAEAREAAMALSHGVEEKMGTACGCIGASFGLGVAFSRSRHTAEKKFEQVMKTCLKEKDYILSD